MKNTLIFLLTALMLTQTVFTSCSTTQSESTPDETEASVQTQTSDDETIPAETEELDMIPMESDDLGEYNFGDADFKMLSPSPDSMTWANPVLNVDEMNGESLNDAIYIRNHAIEERFSVKLLEEYDSWDIGANTLRTIVSSGDQTYAFVSMLDRFALTSMEEGLVVPYANIPNINLEKIYWGGEMLTYSSIGGVNYFAFGDFSLYAYDNISALLFNQNLVSQYNLESPYELVNSGTWTMDKFETMSAVVTDDLDGDGVMTEKDVYGYLAMPKQVLPSFWIAGGTLSISKDDSDIPTLNLNDETFVNLIERTFNMTWDSGVWYQNTIVADTDLTLETMFMNNKGLFHDSTFNKIIRLREMDSDFGIIPYPKADESQNSYNSRLSGALFACVPSIANNLDMTGVVMEALASESRKTVIPTYYEVSMKNKYSRDNASSQMLDIIFSGRVYDLGDTFWCDQIRDNFIKTMMTNNDRNLSSYVAKTKKSLGKKIENSMKNIMAVGNPEQ